MVHRLRRLLFFSYTHTQFSGTLFLFFCFLVVHPTCYMLDTRINTQSLSLSWVNDQWVCYDIEISQDSALVIKSRGCPLRLVLWTGCETKSWDLRLETEYSLSFSPSLARCLHNSHLSDRFRGDEMNLSLFFVGSTPSYTLLHGLKSSSSLIIWYNNIHLIILICWKHACKVQNLQNLVLFFTSAS